MNVYVVDASIVLQTSLNESESVKIFFGKLLKDAEQDKIILISSKLLPIEVANGLRYGIKDKEELIDTFRDFLKTPIKTLVLTNVQKEKTLEIAFDLGTTVYDTSYHVLAKAHNAVFLTCDQEYYKRAKELGDIELII